jgi:hypothetical protein
MPTAAINELDGLIAKLEHELAADPRVALLNNLKAARAAFPDVPSAPAPVATGRTPVEEGGPVLAPARARAFRLCKEYLIGHAEPVRTRTLYDMVERAGVDLPGGMNNLSSMLGRHPKVFRSHGRQGWTLKDVSLATGNEKEEAADDLISRSTSAASLSSAGLTAGGTQPEIRH